VHEFRRDDWISLLRDDGMIERRAPTVELSRSVPGSGNDPKKTKRASKKQLPKLAACSKQGPRKGKRMKPRESKAPSVIPAHEVLRRGTQGGLHRMGRLGEGSP